MIRMKRVYEPAAPGDGARFLVERLWPRGIRKDALAMEGWLREVAPSTALRQWFAHDPAKWKQFQRRYRAELARRREEFRPLLDAARRGRLTLLYSARDNEHNSAVVLKSFLEGRVAKGRPRAEGREKPIKKRQKRKAGVPETGAGRGGPMRRARKFSRRNLP